MPRNVSSEEGLAEQRERAGGEKEGGDNEKSLVVVVGGGGGGGSASYRRWVWLLLSALGCNTGAGQYTVGSFLSVVQQVHLQRLGKRQAQYPLS